MTRNRLLGTLCILFAWGILALNVISAEKPSFTFAAIADTHIASDAELARFRQFLHTVKREHPDFVLILGDLCGHQPEFLPRMKSVIDHCGIPVYPISGNHDDNYAKNTEWYQKVFGKMNYTFDHKGWLFILNWSQSVPTNWLSAQLAETPAGTPVVLCQHYPPQITPTVMELLKDPALAPKVRLVLSGHNHEWNQQQIGAVPSYTLASAFFSGLPDEAHYYLVDAFPDFSVRVRSFNMDELKLEDPPDAQPQVKITVPGNDCALRGDVSVRGTASDDRAVAKVEIRVDGGEWRPAEGTVEWKSTFSAGDLPNGHHLLESRAVDNAGQDSAVYASLLCLVENAGPAPGTLRFQEGAGGYKGCATATARRQGGSATELECWIWKAGEEEFCEFYIRYDLSKMQVPSNAVVRRASLTLYCTRQNFQSLKDRSAIYTVAALKHAWTEADNFETRPTEPGWLARQDPAITNAAWQSCGGMQTITPPKAVVMDLTPMSAVITSWLRNPAENFGLVVSPAPVANYNFSAAASRNPVVTLHPLLEIELDTAKGR